MAQQMPEAVVALVSELDEHRCGKCTPYNLGSGTGTRRCRLAASIRILLFREASRHSLGVIPERLQLWVVGPPQRRLVDGQLTLSEGPNGDYWSTRERRGAAGDDRSLLQHGGNT